MFQGSSQYDRYAKLLVGIIAENKAELQMLGDQYIGQCAARLNQLSKLFAIYPPYFDFSSIEEAIDQACFRKCIEDWLHVRIIEESERNTSSNHFV